MLIAVAEIECGKRFLSFTPKKRHSCQDTGPYI